MVLRYLSEKANLRSGSVRPQDVHTDTDEGRRAAERAERSYLATRAAAGQQKTSPSATGPGFLLGPLEPDVRESAARWWVRHRSRRGPPRWPVQPPGRACRAAIPLPPARAGGACAALGLVGGPPAPGRSIQWYGSTDMQQWCVPSTFCAHRMFPLLHRLLTAVPRPIRHH